MLSRVNILFKIRSPYSEALVNGLFLYEGGCAAPPPFPRPSQCNRFKMHARIPLQAFNNNQQSLLAHVVKSV